MNLRYLWRSLSLVFVLWFALSPALCYASETVTTESAINYDEYAVMPLDFNDDTASSGGLNCSNYFSVSTSNSYQASLGLNGVQTSVGSNFTGSKDYTFSNTSKLSDVLNTGSYPNLVFNYRFFMADGTQLAEADSVIDVFCTGFDVQYREHGHYGYSGSSSHWSSDYTFGSGSLNSKIFNYGLFGARLYDESYNIISIVDASDVKLVNGYLNVYFNELSVNTDVYYFDFIFAVPFNKLDFVYYPSDYGTSTDIYTLNNYTLSLGFVNSNFTIDVVDETKGLLSGIIDWLRSIRDGVTNVFNAITELPAKLWTAIENGLKGLFVPSETDITAMKDKWDTLLSNRFGVVYESGALLIDIANSVQESSTKETISFPSVSYNFSGTEFTFGGYEVDVIPNGFEFLADILKGVIDIVCTLAFINAMRRKYDELMMR